MLIFQLTGVIVAAGDPTEQLPDQVPELAAGGVPE
jgi:hypothetical protein